MAEIVNLNRARKARVRAADALQAAANRLRSGRGKAVRAQAELEQARRERLLDGARQPGDPEPDSSTRTTK